MTTSKRQQKGAQDSIEPSADVPHEEDFYRNHLAYSIMVLANLITKHTSQTTLAESHVNINEWRILRLISLFGPMSAAHIITTIGMDKTTVSRTVTALHKAKLIKLQVHSEDRRQTLLSLTAAGRKILDKIGPLAEASDRSFESELTADELKLIRPIMSKLHKYVKSILN